MRHPLKPVASMARRTALDVAFGGWLAAPASCGSAFVEDLRPGRAWSRSRLFPRDGIGPEGGLAIDRPDARGAGGHPDGGAFAVGQHADGTTRRRCYNSLNYLPAGDAR